MTGPDKFTEIIAELELSDALDVKLNKIAELFKWTYQGFALMQRQIESGSSTMTTNFEDKMKAAETKIDDKFRQMTNQITSMMNDAVTTNSKLISLEAATRQIDATVQQVQQQGQSSGQGSNSGNWQKGILEYKVVQGIKSVTGDKSKFRQWHQKFVNALSQVKSNTAKL